MRFRSLNDVFAGLSSALRQGLPGKAPALAVVVATVLVLIGGRAALAAEDARVWLTDMNGAFNELNYDGVFSFFNGSELASLRIVHVLVDGIPNERLIHQNGAPREIVRRGEEVVCILMPGDDLLALESDRPAGPFARAFVRRYDNLSEYYRLTFSGEDRVADRSAVRLAVSPLDSHRFGYRLWLDTETRLLLKSELVDGDGKPLEIFQFSTLIIGDAVDPTALEPEGETEVPHIRSSLSLDSKPSIPVTEEVRWSPEWLPVGFRMASSNVRTTPNQLKSINTMMFTDGLSAFSVFIEDMPPAGAASMVSRSGATVAVTHLTEGPDAGHHLVTLVGELPTETAQRIARSIRHR
jgi:sigma-E factor negative regulatory protein RseB